MAHLGGFSEEALLLFQHAASEQGYDFSETEDTYDFTRCVRPDGSFYGTSGTCKKGSPAGAKEKAEGKPKMTATPGMAAKAKAAKTKLEKEELQKRASRGDKEAMAKLNKMRAEGKIGKEPGFAPGQKARNDAKEVANVKAGKSPVADVTGAKPKRKLATTAETKPKWQEAERAVVDAKKKYQDANRETKGDQSVEARQRRLQAGRELDKAERAAQKAADKYFAASKRESRAAMTPEQRKEEREWNKFKKTYG